MTTFSETSPNITSWAESCGWIEIGYNDNTRSFMRVLDEGGNVWESKAKYKSLDEALQELEKSLQISEFEMKDKAREERIDMEIVAAAPAHGVY
jgi:hypothetical protein